MTGCSCQIDNMDGDLLYPCDVSLVRARKQHKCCECGRVIEPSEKYERVRGKCDGEWQKFNTCHDCMSVRDAFFCSGMYETMWMDLREYVYEHNGDIPEKCVLQLTDRAREMVLGIVQDVFDDLAAMEEA